MGIIRLAQRQQGHAERLRRRHLALGVLARVDARGTPRAAAAGKIGQRRERGAGATAVIDQGAEGARPDMVAADEAQPVEALFVGQAGGFKHGAYPSLSMPMRTKRVQKSTGFPAGRPTAALDGRGP